VALQLGTKINHAFNYKLLFANKLRPVSWQQNYVQECIQRFYCLFVFNYGKLLVTTLSSPACGDGGGEVLTLSNQPQQIWNEQKQSDGKSFGANGD
jgi:hypothetical protein